RWEDSEAPRFIPTEARFHCRCLTSSRMQQRFREWYCGEVSRSRVWDAQAPDHGPGRRCRGVPSVYLRPEQLLRAGAIDICFRHEIDASVDVARYVLALRCGNSNPDAVVTHSEWILHNEPRNNAIADHLNHSIVGAKANEVDLLAQLVSLRLGERLGSASHHRQIRCKHATQLRMGLDDAH